MLRGFLRGVRAALSEEKERPTTRTTQPVEAEVDPPHRSSFPKPVGIRKRTESESSPFAQEELSLSPWPAASHGQRNQAQTAGSALRESRSLSIERLFETLLDGRLAEHEHVLTDHVIGTEIRHDDLVLDCMKAFQPWFLDEIVRRFDALPPDKREKHGWVGYPKAKRELRWTYAIMALVAELEADLFRQITALPDVSICRPNPSKHLSELLTVPRSNERLFLAKLIGLEFYRAEQVNRLLRNTCLRPDHLKDSGGFVYHFWANHPLGGGRGNGVAAIPRYEDLQQTIAAVRDAARPGPRNGLPSSAAYLAGRRVCAIPFISDGRSPRPYFLDSLGIRPRVLDAFDLDWASARAKRSLYEELPHVILLGGPDIPRYWYDTATRTKQSTARDRVESLLAHWALEDGKPMHGICRGMQLLNVAAGGSLYPELREAYPHADAERHRRGDHPVRIDPTSQLARRLGLPTRNEPTNPETWPTIVAPSSHHQCIRDVAAGFRVVALAPDGVIEAIEHVDFPDRYWGVQFHPERNLMDPQLRQLTQALLLGEATLWATEDLSSTDLPRGG